jgi:hypothetical protein
MSDPVKKLHMRPWHERFYDLGASVLAGELLERCESF